MAFTFRGATTTITSGSSPRTQTNPALAGDLVILQVSSSGADVTPTPPGNFSEIVAARNTTVPTIRVYWAIEGGSPPANYTVTFPSGSGHSISLQAWDFSEGSVQVDDADTQSNAAGDRIHPSVDSTVANDLLFCCAALGNVGSTPPGGMTERYDDGSSPRIHSMTQIFGSVGATGTRTATGVASANQASSVLFKEVGGGGGSLGSGVLESSIFGGGVVR